MFPFGSQLSSVSSRGMVCSSLKNISEWIRVDEGLDVFKLHGIGGMVGAFLTGIFADNRVSMLDGFTNALGGIINGNGVQVGKQLRRYLRHC